MHAPALTASRRVGDAAIADRLRRETEAEVLWTAADRGRYATDASIYQIEPIGVVVPRRTEDVATTIAIAGEAGVPVLPRGGGTSQCGQTVNQAIVIDCTKYLRRIIGTEGTTVTVEPGIVLSDLNAALRATKRFFPVDPSTHLRCTIGGMAGNNSCGAKSIVHGLMADNVLAIEAILADGTPARFAEESEAPAPLLAALRAIGAAEATTIAEKFPRQLRRVGGYNIDALVPPAPASNRPRNLSRLLVGSEGTLAFSTALTLKLSPVKPRKVLGICQFPTFRSAMEAAGPLVTLGPEAVELVDATMIALGRSIPIFRPTIDAMVIGAPAALLIVEFHGHEDAPLLAKLGELEAMMGALGHGRAAVRATDAAFQAGIAAVREAGLNIMMSMKGDGKPVSFIEDAAVDLADLADYTERLEAVFRRHGTSGTWYAHASVGCLHVRPVLNMKDPADVARMRAIAEECFALVRAYKGSHSGEHGDGIVRSEFNEVMFGPRIARAFEAVKDAFDPKNLFNPGRIVRPPRMDDRSLFRYRPGYEAAPGFTQALDWSAWPGPLGGMLGAVEMCNNNGTCRKFDADVMCPSYRVTRDEQHLTRGRANTLRLALTGQLGADAMAGEAVAEAVKLCVGCKGCRRECPTGVDMAKMKLEVLHARAKLHGVGLRERLIAELPARAGILSRLGPLLGLRDSVPGLARLSERLLGLAAGRSLPRWSRAPFRDAEADATGSVLLFADTFNRWFEPENLRAALGVLRAAGHRVRAPAAAGRPLCCGRAWLAAGMLERARAEAKRTIEALSGSDDPVIGLEPSCLLTLRDEFPALLPGAAAERLAGRALLLGEFLAREAKAGRPGPRFRPMPATLHIHGHFHQKAFQAFAPAVASLRAIPELTVHPIAASCCGMAGAFGYQAETAEISRAMGELALLPAVRAAASGDLIVADGTSCRHQIRDLAGREAVHSVRVMEQALA